MANQKTNEPTPLGKLFGVVGLVTGFMVGWNSSQNFMAALICGLIVGGLGVAAGNLVHKILIITISILLTIGTSYCRHEVFRVIRESPQQSQPGRQSPTISEKPDVTPKSARVIAQRANLRSKPDSSAAPDNKPLLELEMGERLVLLSPYHDGRGWYHVQHDRTGQEGWIHGNNIEFE
jgi:hypothetical protein